MSDVTLTADIVALRRRSRGGIYKYQVLLVKRGKPPFEGQWALPGGHVDPGERFWDAARREFEEEAGIPRGSLPDGLLVGVYDEPKRDPRGRVISVAYVVILDSGVPDPVAGDDAAEAVWADVFTTRGADVSTVHGLAFDHDVILGDALAVVGLGDQ